MSPPIAWLDNDTLEPVRALRQLLGTSKEVFFATAYVRLGAVGLIASELGQLSKRGGQLRLLTTFDFGLTQPEALDQLGDLGAEVRVAHFGGRTYHPKVYLGRDGPARQAIVGSMNLTAAALLRNVEGSVIVSGSEANAVYDGAWRQFDAMWRSHAAIPCPRGLTTPPQPRTSRVIWSLLDQLGVDRPRTDPNAPVGLEDPLAVPTDDEEFAVVWRQVAHLCATATQVRTATGTPNTLLSFDHRRGVLVGTKSSPGGEVVDRGMFERVVAAVCRDGHLMLNAPPGSSQIDATTFLRVHRSSAVFAILGALPGFRLVARPRVELWLDGLDN